MHRLEDQFRDRIDFIYLNVDVQETLEIRQRFDIVNRTQYVLIDADGQTIQSWFGFLDENQIAESLNQFLIANS